MLDHSRAASSPRWMRVYGPLAGAAVALAVGGWLTFAGVDLARNGCACDEPWYADWIWAPLLILAAVFLVSALALFARFVANERAAGTDWSPEHRHRAD